MGENFRNDKIEMKNNKIALGNQKMLHFLTKNIKIFGNYAE